MDFMNETREEHINVGEQQSLSIGPELRLSLERRKQQLKLQEEAIDQLLAAAPPMSISLSTRSTSLCIDTNMTRSSSQRKRSCDDEVTAPLSMDRSMALSSTMQAPRLIARPGRPRNTSMSNQHLAAGTGSSFNAARGYSASFPSAGLGSSTAHMVMSPSEFINRHGSGENDNKRSRTSSSSLTTPVFTFSPSQHALQTHMLPFDGTVNPDMLGTSFQSSAHSALGMSRQSSIAGCSTLGEGMGMMRLMSNTSYTQSQPETDICFEQFPLEDLEQPKGQATCNLPTVIQTAATWSSSGTDTARNATDSATDISLVGDGSVLDQIGAEFDINGGNISDISYHSHPSEMAGVFPLDSVSMKRSSSNESCDSTSSSKSAAERKASERNQRHIRNSMQAIKSKADTSSSTDATPPKTDKKLITKVPYQRPRHAKKFCELCTEKPDGYHGVHELRRHQKRAHGDERKAWVCTQPTFLLSGQWPKIPLSKCKQCQIQKKYHAYYNAAAHIRRSHFHPRKRGRRPKGEVSESRAGKTGGDDPSIQWLKDNGWLRQVEVSLEEWRRLQTKSKCTDDKSQAAPGDNGSADVFQSFEGLETMFDDSSQSFESQNMDGGQYYQHAADSESSMSQVFWQTLASQPNLEEQYQMDHAVEFGQLASSCHFDTQL